MWFSRKFGHLVSGQKLAAHLFSGASMNSSARKSVSVNRPEFRTLVTNIFKTPHFSRYSANFDCLLFNKPEFEDKCDFNSSQSLDSHRGPTSTWPQLMVSANSSLVNSRPTICRWAASEIWFLTRFTHLAITTQVTWVRTFQWPTCSCHRRHGRSRPFTSPNSPSSAPWATQQQQGPFG